jgi:hypothetical protein
MLPSRCPKSFAVLVTLAALAAAAPALAGPPLLCHPFDTGGAKSLPWDHNNGSWNGARADYALNRLVADTEALLTPSTPVIARMETMRRAGIYASRDPKVAAQLFTTLSARTEAAGREDKAGALAYLDAAYFVEAIRQLSQMSKSGEFGDRGPALRAIVQGTDGYALASKALSLRPGEPALEFAAALISIDRHRDAYPRHAEKARAGAAQDTLLARNIEKVQ